MTVFYLGTHRPNWLATLDVPLMVSYTVLRGRKRLPQARAPWVLDSGGFTELQRHGRWTIPPEEYAEAADRYRTEIGNMDWATPQDWVCNPIVRTGGETPTMTFAGTHRTVEEHQALSLASFLRLRELAPAVRWIPMLQGWDPDDYVRHATMYEDAGINLADAATVGVGSIASRQDTGDAEVILQLLAERGYRLHGFGVKWGGLARSSRWLTSADSMNWSDRARRQPAMEGCTHRNCSNCHRYALAWRSEVIRRLTHEQGRLDVGVGR